ncbi:MAG: HIT domain-containing protein [Anaerolineaceae bacterium]|nr:HIT domain-containing protein [Anaerolineaceae bacterium]
MNAWVMRLARSRWAGRFIGWVFAHMSFILPVERLYESDTLVAFRHPQPSYPVHILIVSKRAYASLLDVPAQDSAFLADLMTVVQKLVRELNLEEKGYRLIANGGAFQDVAQLHFHLVAGS